MEKEELLFLELESAISLQGGESRAWKTQKRLLDRVAPSLWDSEFAPNFTDQVPSWLCNPYHHTSAAIPPVSTPSQCAGGPVTLRPPSILFPGPQLLCRGKEMPDTLCSASAPLEISTLDDESLWEDRGSQGR